MPRRSLTHKQEKFAIEVVRTGNQSEAYRIAYNPSPTTSKDRITHMACGVASHPNVAARINELKAKAVDNVLMDAEAVVRHLSEIAMADPNELMQHRRVNCRYCNGVDHAYQWKHKGEYEHAVDQWTEQKEAHEQRQNKAGKQAPFKKPMPVDDGGYGFRSNADPHPNCPECEGEGIEEIFIQDSRKLSGPAKRLFAGVKQTKNGIEVLTRSQDLALKLLGEKYGVFKTVIDATVKSDNTNVNANVNMTLDQLRELAKSRGLPESIFDKRK
jgi:phage terminase small subunit